MAAHGGHTRASGGRTVKMNVPVLFPLRTSLRDRHPTVELQAGGAAPAAIFIFEE